MSVMYEMERGGREEGGNLIWRPTAFQSHSKVLMPLSGSYWLLGSPLCMADLFNPTHWLLSSTPGSLSSIHVV